MNVALPFGVPSIRMVVTSDLDDASDRTDAPDRPTLVGQDEDPLLSPTLFHERWWLNAATRGQFEEVSVTSGGRTVGRLPFVRRSMAGLTECVLPPLTPFLGPAVLDGEGRATRRQSTRRTIVQALLRQLPPHSRFQQRLHAGVPDTLAFVEQGFSSRSEFTYEVAPAAERDLWRDLKDKTRNVIRRSQEGSQVVDLDPGDFSRFYEANLQRRGKMFNHMWQRDANALFHAAIDRGRGRLTGAVDAEGRLAAAIFVAWDSSTAYLMLTSRLPAAGNGMISRLIWDAIAAASREGRVFDFGGVGTRGSILFYSGFGGEVRPRFLIERTTPLFHTIDLTIRKSRGLGAKILSPLTRRLTPAPSAPMR